MKDKILELIGKGVFTTRISSTLNQKPRMMSQLAFSVSSRGKPFSHR